MVFSIETIDINLPFGIGGTTILLTDSQKDVAWALYVEYATRVSTEPLPEGMGSAREALNSLHSLFGTTRQILRDTGPKANDGPHSVGPLAIAILNKGLRPFMVKWHTELTRYENAQIKAGAPVNRGRVDESEWHLSSDFYRALEDKRQELELYVNELARIANVAA